MRAPPAKKVSHLKQSIRVWFKNWAALFPYPVISVDFDLRILLANDVAKDVYHFDFRSPQYLENYFHSSLLPHFLDFKKAMKASFYAEHEIKLDHTGYTKMIGHYFEEELGYYVILMIPNTYRERYDNLEKRYQILMRHISDSVLITNEDQKILEANQSFTNITGYTFEDVEGRFPTILSSGKHNSSFYKNMFVEMETKGYYQGELIDRKKSGEMIHVQATITPIKNDDRIVTNYVGILKDITELKVLRTKVNTTQHRDPLTGVQNRDSFLSILEIKCELSNMENSLALLFIDLDKFKQVNDTYGHQYGDFVLAKAAKRIQKTLRNNDMVGRYGGDEFLVMLERVSKDNAYAIAEKITQALSKPYVVDEQVIDFISGSIGIAFAPSDGRNSAQLIEKADSAMYRAKKTSNVHNILMADALKDENQDNKTLRTELIQAVEHNEFHIRIQPIVDIRSAQTKGGEVLARWLNLYFDEVPPGTFIPLAQTLGIIKKFDENVLALTIETLIGQKLPQDFFINVNFSAEQFADYHFVDKLRALVRDQPWIVNHLVVEITEGTMIANIEQTSEYLIAIRELGLKVAIDDFGAGFSSLAYLKHFSIDYLKIDISFVQYIEANDKDREIIRTIATLARAIGAKTIIEGIERESQYAIVKELDIDYAQGFLFARPQLSESFFSQHIAL